jgi:hypothetical protein
MAPWQACVAVLCSGALAGCANGSSSGDFSVPPGGDEGSIDASSSGNASSGEPAAWAGSTSGVATSGSGGSSGSGPGGGNSGGSPSGSLSTSGASAGATPSASSGGGGAAGNAGGTSTGAQGGSPASDSGSPCRAGPLYPISATASSVADPSDASGGSFAAQNAIDNNLATRWESAFRLDPSSITLDFGFPVHIAELDILWHSDCASAYDIDISPDGASWTTLKSLTTNPPSSQAPPTTWTNDDVEKLSAVGRYVRVHGTRRAQSQFGYSIWEMRALGDRDASCTP